MRSTTVNVDRERESYYVKHYWLGNTRIETFFSGVISTATSREESLQRLLSSIAAQSEANFPSLNKRENRRVSYLTLYKHIITINLYFESDKEKALQALEHLTHMTTYIQNFNDEAIAFAAKEGHLFMLFYFFKQGKISQLIFNLMVAITKQDIKRVASLCKNPGLFTQGHHLDVCLNSIVKMLIYICIDSDEKQLMIQAVLKYLNTNVVAIELEKLKALKVELSEAVRASSSQSQAKQELARVSLPDPLLNSPSSQGSVGPSASHFQSSLSPAIRARTTDNTLFSSPKPKPKPKPKPQPLPLVNNFNWVKEHPQVTKARQRTTRSEQKKSLKPLVETAVSVQKAVSSRPFPEIPQPLVQPQLAERGKHEGLVKNLLKTWESKQAKEELGKRKVRELVISTGSSKPTFMPGRPSKMMKKGPC